MTIDKQLSDLLPGNIYLFPHDVVYATGQNKEGVTQYVGMAINPDEIKQLIKQVVLDVIGEDDKTACESAKQEFMLIGKNDLRLEQR